MISHDVLWRVEAPHFVAGILVTQDGAISDAAPILKWSRGKSFLWFRNYCKSKGWWLVSENLLETDVEGRRELLDENVDVPSTKG